MKTLEIAVASLNPVKINTVESGFKKVFPKKRILVTGTSIRTSRLSKVGDQPTTDQQTFMGAINRVRAVACLSPKADFWVGIEGGVDTIDQHMVTFAWVVIQSLNKVGKARTGTFFLPAKVAELVKQGYELGDADDIVFGKTNSKQANGAVGLLTHDIITRTSFYESAVILALIPFLNPKLFP